MNSKAISLIRYDNVNGVLSNSMIVSELLRSYYEADSAKWLPLFRKDEQGAAFLYNVLYPSPISTTMSLGEKGTLDKTMYDLMLLSCNFDREHAKAAGLYQVDSTINNSKKYTYKFAMYTASTSVNTTPLLSVNIDASQLSTNKSITDLKGKNKNKLCILNWKAANYSSDYFGYNIYRSIDNRNYTLVNKAPIVLLRNQFEPTKEYIHYTDTLKEPDKKYYYHIKGINLFGEESEPSNTYSLISMTEITSVPIIDSITVIQNGMVKLKWRMENNNETNLPGKYFLQKSTKENTGYKTIYESSKELTYIDKDLWSTNYYKIGVILANNDTLFSHSRYATIIDTVPPNIPTGLKAIVDKRGIVTLSWKKNKETDIQGYKLYKANRINDEFVQINEEFITDSFTTDKLYLKTLSKKIYYKIAASDNNYNTSVPSEAIEVKRPDTIAPQAPLLVSVSQNTNGLLIAYILSKSEDVAKHVLLKKKLSDKEFADHLEFGKSDSLGNILDTLIEQGETYVYKIKATDEDNNTSYSRELDFLFETGFRKRISDISYKVDRREKKIDLNWKYDEKNIDKFVIYRSKKDEKPTIIKTLDGNNLQFTDKTISMGNIYEYRIKASMENGTESIISLPISIEY